MEYRLSAQFRLDGAGRPLRHETGPAIEEAGRHYRARDYPAAARVCDAILALRPQDFDALHLRGVLFLEEQRPADALDHLRRASQTRADVAQLQFNIGNALMALKRHGDAAEAFCHALALRPDDPDTLNNLGNALLGDSRYQEAEACLRRTLALRPGSAKPLYNLGRALVSLDQLEDAAACFQEALAAAGSDLEERRLIDLYVNLCDVRVRQGRYEEALAICRGVPQSIAHAPAIRWNESLTLLILGDYAEGWRKYECRFQVPDHDPPREAAAALDLDTVAGKRVLVFPEQGRGDMIQFARYLPMLAARGATALVEMYADLIPLFERIEGVAQVGTPDDPPSQYDLLTPLLSLPAAFGTTLDRVPDAVPYLSVPLQRRMQWAAWLGPRQRRRVGIAWRGSTESAPRSALPLPALAPLLALAGVEFHCLHKEVSPEDRTWLDTNATVTCHDARLGDFADTAALIEQLDLVISIDTAVAHLAGALAKSAWIMLPFSPDWRWLRHREDSPWYPTARLFRQPRRGDWDDVVRRVAGALLDMV
ncbi:MAG TPA: tetratricopeptide repeat-containing glycosyltransferase family protein [Acetobacteraceae bacterium]|nr:tetratricopeptide repeat-containing glycosyltransferase family protein [Acetobacteraceae bacterium]